MKAATFLMFEGNAEEAMNLYASLFDEAEPKVLLRHGASESGQPGKIMLAELTLAGHRLLFSDSPVHHGFTFTPSISLFIDFPAEEQLANAYARLSEGGGVMMPLGEYGFSRKFGWVADRFGVSWQLNLPFPSDAGPK